VSDLPYCPPPLPLMRQAAQLFSYLNLSGEAQRELQEAADKFRETCLKWSVPDMNAIHGIPISFPMAEHFRKLGYDEGKRVGSEAIYKAAQAWLKEQEK